MRSKPRLSRNVIVPGHLPRCSVCQYQIDLDHEEAITMNNAFDLANMLESSVEPSSFVLL